MANDPQSTHTTTPAAGRPEEMRTLRCPSPTCNAHLLAYRATSDLQIEIKCHACSRRKRRGVWRSFVINYQPPAEQT